MRYTRYALCFCAPQVEPRVLATGVSSGIKFTPRRKPVERLVALVPPSSFQRHPLRVAPRMAAQDMPPYLDEKKKPGPNLFWISVIAELCLGATGALLCFLSSESILGPGFSVKPQLVGAAVLATVPLCMFSWGVGKLDSQVREITVEYCREIFLRRSTLEIALFCACVALGEELFFRSWVLQKSIHIFGNLQGQVGSSLLFGLCHGQSVTLIAASGLSGYFFSWLFISSGQSVALPFLVHFIYNFSSILLFKREILREGKK